MKTYIYKYVVVDGGTTGTVEAALNAWGAKGWKLHQLLPGQKSTTHLVFMHEREPETALSTQDIPLAGSAK